MRFSFSKMESIRINGVVPVGVTDEKISAFWRMFFLIMDSLRVIVDNLISDFSFTTQDPGAIGIVNIAVHGDISCGSFEPSFGTAT